MVNSQRVISQRTPIPQRTPVKNPPYVQKHERTKSVVVRNSVTTPIAPNIEAITRTPQKETTQPLTTINNNRSQQGSSSKSRYGNSKCTKLYYKSGELKMEKFLDLKSDNLKMYYRNG